MIPGEETKTDEPAPMFVAVDIPGYKQPFELRLDRLEDDVNVLKSRQ